MKVFILFAFLFLFSVVLAQSCPCRCIVGAGRRNRAEAQCSRGTRSVLCEVTRCRRNGRGGFQCCAIPEVPTPSPEAMMDSPSPPTPSPEAMMESLSPTPMPETPAPDVVSPTPIALDCPCRCRIGRPGRRRAQRMCRRNPGCEVSTCGRRRFHCCNPTNMM